MSQALTPARVGTLLQSEEDINVLPAGAVVLADPEGLHRYEYSRRMPLKKLDYDYEGDVFWEPSHGEPITSSEAVHRWQLAPFLVLWLPPVDAAAQAAA